MFLRDLAVMKFEFKRANVDFVVRDKFATNNFKEAALTKI